MRVVVKLLVALPLFAALAAAAPLPTVEHVSAPPPKLQKLAFHAAGRGLATTAGFARQWPGTYFEAAFRGTGAFIKVGAGDVSLRVSLDGGAAIPIVKPVPGYYRISGLMNGTHRLRVDVVSESQAGPTVLGGFYAPAGSALPAPAPRKRQIEFIGDSHTVGYGNTSATRDCSQNDVWQTTDTSRGVAAQTARRYDADYQVNAISGRGIVRNYGGSAGATLPQAYPFTLFDQAQNYRNPAWHPQLVVVSLGTNDFSTPLKPGEPWATRDALHAAYEQGYAALIGRLRHAYPSAFILLWSTDPSGNEITNEVAKVAAAASKRDRRVAAVSVRGLAMSGCHFHPSVADDGKIADALAGYIDRRSDIWRAR